MNVFSHSGDLGDLIYALPVIEMLGGGKLCLIRADCGIQTPFIPSTVESLKPLLEAQSYIMSIEYIDTKTAIGVDLDKWRKYVSMYDRAHYNLVEMQAITVGLHYSHKCAWLKINNPNKIAKVVIARSLSHHNPTYKSLLTEIYHKYSKSAIFVGYRSEYDAWCVEFGSEIDYYPTSTIWELSRVISGAEIFIGNSSLPLAIAVGLYTPTIIHEPIPVPIWMYRTFEPDPIPVYLYRTIFHRPGFYYNTGDICVAIS